MKIDDLPVELVMKIFSFLKNYKNVSLVSSKFYDISCRMKKNVSHLLSIENTNRKVSKVVIRLAYLNEEKIRRVVSVIQKFSANIIFLRLKGHEDFPIAKGFFLDILWLVPNLKHLDCIKVTLQRAQHYLNTPSNEELNLKHLKTLKLDKCCEELVVVFDRLPPEVLTELRLTSVILRRLKEQFVFKRQTSVKKLALNLCRADYEGQLVADILDNLTLESLEICQQSVKNIVTTLSRHTKLKSLKLRSYQENDERLMKNVTNHLRELQKLDWNVVRTPVNDFKNIEKFEYLKHLTIIGDRPDIVDALCELDNSRIISLEMAFNRFSEDQIRALAISAPKLKVVKVSHTLSWEGMKTFLKHFNFVECLKFSLETVIIENDNSYLNQSDSSNPKLTELKIHFGMNNFPGIETLFITKMIVDYPNLKTLVLRHASMFITSQFQLILSGLRKIESLKLSGYKCSNEWTVDDFIYLRNHKKDVKDNDEN